MRIDALLDTGASRLTLPITWKDRLGEMELVQPVTVELATQSTAVAEVCGPVRIELEGFRPVSGEVLFLDMEPANGVANHSWGIFHKKHVRRPLTCWVTDFFTSNI